MKDELLNFIIGCDYNELVAICDEYKRKSYNGADTKDDLLHHLTAHFAIYEEYEKNESFPEKIRQKCHNNIVEIENIILQHKKMMYMLDRNKLQLKLMSEHKLNDNDWIEKYSEKFSELVDQKKYRCIDIIKFYLYKD